MIVGEIGTTCKVEGTSIRGCARSGPGGGGAGIFGSMGSSAAVFITDKNVRTSCAIQSRTGTKPGLPGHNVMHLLVTCMLRMGLHLMLAIHYNPCGH
jgi:hypothetical protein